jgi:putative ABC transport system permease protein
MEATLKQSGTLDTAIVLQMGSGSEVGSLLPPETVAVVSDAPQILQNAQKHPIASAELVVTAALPAKNARRNVNVAMRGVEERIWELRPDVEIIAGRKFKPGLGELLVGYGSYEKLASSDIGSKLTLNGQSFTIVGIFDSKDACNSELWGDRTVLASAFHRGSNATSSIRVRLTDARDFDAFKVALAGDPRINVDAQTTREFYNRQSEPFTRLIHVVCVTVGIIMAFGAVFGALNAMYATITARSREIAILRAIGFRSVPVIGSVLLEMMLLAGAGGVAGAAIAWITFDGFIASTTGESGQIVFAFNASPALLWDGLTWALTIGLLGGLLPAVRAAYMPITAGLRDA